MTDEKFKMDNTELVHWGVKGQKWGIRRYQNKDGSLTPAGQKRYNKEMEKLKAEEKVLKTKARTQAKLGKLDAKRQELDELRKKLDDDKGTDKTKTESPKSETKPVKKKLKDMSDEELRSVINRIDMEKRYSELTAPQKTKGEKFIKSILSDMVAPAAADLGKQYIKSILTKAANEISGLPDEYKMYTNNKKK